VNRLETVVISLAFVTAFAAPGARAADEPAGRSELWVANCQKCHGPEGKGDTEEGKKKGARDLSNAKWQKTISDDRMIRSVTRGRDKMPSFAKVLTEEQIRELIKEVRTLAVPSS
jgi:mono/diheme cytochrome c family protein